MQEDKQERNDPESKKILIADDDETILHFLKKVFMERGFKVLVAENGSAAVDILKAERPALVLTDLKMPSLSGIELIEFIHENMREIPIVVMTAGPNLYPENGASARVKAYFRKPFDIDEMLSSVEDILEEKRKSESTGNFTR